MEVAERAQEHEAREWELRNAPRPGRTTYQPTDAGYGPAECEECGADMPAVRRAMGAKLCTQHQAEREQRQARGRRY